jgi:DNA-binding response OmpR family regulator
MAEKTRPLLMVDEDRTILQLLATALGRENYEVSTASGHEGLRMATDSPVEVALLGTNLPNLSGIEVMRQIVKTTRTMVILITGDDAHCSHKSAVQERAFDFIVKPFWFAELAMRTRQAREMRSLTEAKERCVRRNGLAGTASRWREESDEFCTGPIGICRVGVRP